MSGHLDLVMKHAVDSAVNAAIERFRDRLGEDGETVHLIAHTAAEIAVEQFSSYCAVELSLIKADHELRLRDAMRRPPTLIFKDAP
jgi:adenine-specific DNA methylase